MLLRMSTAIVLIFTCTSTLSDTLGIYGGIGYWDGSFSGSAIDNVSLNTDLDTQKDDGGYAYIALEHPIPFLPNVKASYTTLSDSSVNTLTKDFLFNGIAFAADQQVDTLVDLTHVDVTFYYEMLDVGYDLDLGVTGRYFIGELTISGVKEDVVALLPMGYARAKFPMPFSGWFLGAEINASSDIQDYQITIGWETKNFLLPEFGIELGYRKFKVDADADAIDVDMDIETDGLIIGFIAHF